MSVLDRYKIYEERFNQVKNDRLGQMFIQQEKRYVHPFQIYGNVWYVGDSWVCVHLIDTGSGLLLIDTGNCGAEAMLIQAIWEAGFNPKDVKWIILSHGHMDHIGAAGFFRNMFGSKIYLGAPDAKMYREHPELSFIQDSVDPSDELTFPDEEIHDGDLLTFGSVNMQFYLVPGHTMGAVACFFDAVQGDAVMRCGYYGGFGFNTLAKDYLLEIGDVKYKTRHIYLDSLKKVRDQHVDIFLGNHTNNNQTLLRREKQIQNPDTNPFIDAEAWGNYLDQKKNDLLQFMADPKNN